MSPIELLIKEGQGAAVGRALGREATALAENPGALKSLGKMIKDFAKRTVYSTTGRVPGVKGKPTEEVLEEIGHLTKKTPIQDLKKEYAQMSKAEKWLKGGEETYVKKKQKKEEALRHMAKEYGTVGKTLKGIALHPVDIVRTGWRSMGPGGKLFFGGLTGMEGYRLASLPPEERLKALGPALASTALFAPTMGMSAVPQMGVWVGGEHAAEKLTEALAKKKAASYIPRLKPLVLK